MGAEQFVVKVQAANADLAFKLATDQARYDHGHAGYTGTIAEKDSFVMLEPCPDVIKPAEYAELLFDREDPRIDDKWGPAGCFQTAPTEFYFIGWASS